MSDSERECTECNGIGSDKWGPGWRVTCQKCDGLGKEPTAPAPISARERALVEALEARCPWHYGDDREDFPTATHRHLGKHGWETAPCALTEAERAALAAYKEVKP